MVLGLVNTPKFWFDDLLSNVMDLQLNYVNNSKNGLYQSDEMYLIFTNIDNINLIYDGKIQKIASITAKATSTFNSLMLRMLQRLNIHKKKTDKIANDNFPEINAF
jgi:hypothetical protein